MDIRDGYYTVASRTAWDGVTQAVLRNAGFGYSRNANIFFTKHLWPLYFFWRLQDMGVTVGHPEITKRLKVAYTREQMARMPDWPHKFHPDALPHQNTAVAFSTGLRSMMLADDMGIGKTVTAALIARHRQVKRLLIVSPASHLDGWAEEMKQWHPEGLPIQVVYKRDQPIYRGCTTVLSHALLEHRFEALQDQVYQTVISDETHKWKDFSATRTRLGLQLAQRSPFFIGLSGSWPPNHPGELYPVVGSTAPETIDYMSQEQFESRYCTFKTNRIPVRNGVEQKYRMVSKVNGGQNLQELGSRLRSTIMIRRLTNQVFKSLPPTQHRLVERSPDEQMLDLLAEEATFSEAVVRAISNDGSVRETEAVSRVRKALSLLKAPWIFEHAMGVLQKTHKVLVYVYHVDTYQYLFKKFQEAGMNPVGIRGSVPARKRKGIERQFQTDDSARVWMGQLQAAGECLTLTAGHWLILGEWSWVPGENAQILKRIRRYGQVRQTISDWLAIKGSLDGRVLRVAFRKQRDINELHDETGDEW